jgi:hypothetical protein
MLWPRWLAEDIDGLAIWSIGYGAPISRLRGDAMHLVDRAEWCYSGGLRLRNILQAQKPNWQFIARRSSR